MSNEKMNCEQISELLPDYLQGSLGRGQEDLVERHLRECAACRESVALWNKLSLLPKEEPSPALRARFEAMMLAYEEARRAESSRAIAPPAKVVPIWGGSGWQQWAAGLAAAVVLLIIGFSAGRYSGLTRDMSAPQELTAVRAELSYMRQLVVLSMMQQQSASERLQGIAWSAQQGQTDPKVLEALVRALRFDSSVDVRLAALTALTPHGKQPIVKTGLIEALQPQQSPLVQVALIDLMVEQRDRSAVRQLQNFQQNPQLNPAVRKRAEWALAKLNVN
ncbi:MAG: zf-HC2 domain-containing protein [Acidobacteria bacterium]|nr:zf-HC2 domain-containing protein [Acidobacteriota bacterium]